VAISPDGGRLAVGNENGIRLWELAKGKRLYKSSDASKPLKGFWNVESLAFSPDGKRLAFVAGIDSNFLATYAPAGVYLLDLATRRTDRLQDNDPERGGPVALCFSSDGKLLAFANPGGAVRFWELAAGKEARRLEGHKGNLTAISLSSDGKSAVTAGEDGTVRVWDLEGGKERFRLKGITETCRALALSLDGKSLAAIDSSRAVLLFDASSGKLLRRCRGHALTDVSLAFSPDGKTLASVGEGSAVRRPAGVP
jgi:WD40 repeat protein